VSADHLVQALLATVGSSSKFSKSKWLDLREPILLCLCALGTKVCSENSESWAESSTRLESLFADLFRNMCSN